MACFDERNEKRYSFSASFGLVHVHAYCGSKFEVPHVLPLLKMFNFNISNVSRCFVIIFFLKIGFCYKINII